jgi:Peptidase inhibitor family I36
VDYDTPHELKGKSKISETRRATPRRQHLRGKNMHARKTAALAIIAGLATAGSLAGATMTASADTRPRPASSIAATPNGGAATTQGNVKAPLPKLDKKSKAAGVEVASRNAAKGSVHAAGSYSNCFQLSNLTGTLCSYWNSNYGGSRGGTYYADPDWWDNYFATAGSGQWQSMKNNSASVSNWDAYLTSNVYTEEYYSGAWGTIKPYVGGNYVSTFWLNVESNKWS